MPYFKKIKLSALLTTLLFMGMNLFSYGQEDKVISLVNSLNSYSRQNFQEKIFAHTDKSFYVCGEIIWFKLYNTDASFNKPLTISKIAYVELLSSDQKPVLQAKIELKDGTGSGSFLLPFSLNSGTYVLRAYTNWMKNYSPEFFFESRLTVINTLKKLNITKSDSIAYDARFYPEGGNLVNSLESKVAFHVVAENGKGLDCKGIVYDQNNDSITSFRPLRFGMGHFSFTPVKGNSYKAIIQTDDGKTITRALPSAYESGYVMKLNPSTDGTIRVTVHSRNNNEFIFLLVHTRQVI